ncbi:DUF4399 domain-containing protein [Pseudomonadota bacterium]
MIKQITAAAVAVLLLSGCSDAVYFKGVSDGDTVSSPFAVKMSVCGMDVQKAGDVVEGAGHHHLIIDGDCIAKGETVPKDANHKHFGKGQTETTLNLEPGDHTLTLQFANGVHASYGEKLCKTIKITVE